MYINAVFILFIFEAVKSDTGYNYNPQNQDETEVEVIKVEVYEVPWVGDDQGSGAIPQNNGPESFDQRSFNPPQTYGVPHDMYGPPMEGEDMGTTTILPEITTTDNPENATVSQKSAKLTSASNVKQQEGYYYIYHPSGLLQKVGYLTNEDAQNMEFSAKLKYENVKPVTGPIFTYDPESYVFSRLNRK